MSAADVAAGLPDHNKNTISSALSEFSDRGAMTRIGGHPCRYMVTPEQNVYMLANTASSAPDILSLIEEPHINQEPPVKNLHNFDATRVFNVTVTPITPPWRKKNGGKASPVFRGELADGTFVYRYRSGGILTHSTELGLETNSSSLVEAWFKEADYRAYQRFQDSRTARINVIPASSLAEPAEKKDYTDADLDHMAEESTRRSQAREKYLAARAVIGQLATRDPVALDLAAKLLESLRQDAYRR